MCFMTVKCLNPLLPGQATEETGSDVRSHGRLEERKEPMNKIEFYVDAAVIRCHNAAILLPDEDPLEALVEAAMETISTSVMITCGGVKMAPGCVERPRSLVRGLG